MGAIKTMKEVESALPQKKEINCVRALDKDGNPILINKEDLAQVVGELINKYTPLKSWAELDNLKWDNAPKGNVYTVSWLPDYDSEQHPANVGCVEVVRMGGGVTAQILYADNLKMYIRTILGTEEARWTAWTQV
ncbi:hypothetical protein [Bacteroides stercoris]|uniref:hypothetical protein n=1 Tax=Bacteroides stercoris TaxID=46506 RepID=UPI0034A38DB3